MLKSLEMLGPRDEDSLSSSTFSPFFLSAKTNPHLLAAGWGHVFKDGPTDVSGNSLCKFCE